jgi:hypothetical protein
MSDTPARPIHDDGESVAALCSKADLSISSFYKQPVVMRHRDEGGGLV